MTHDPLCPRSEDHHDHGAHADAVRHFCLCLVIAQARADERAWVVKNAAEEIERHIIKNGTCACFEEQITDPRLHYAEMVRYTGGCLLPQVPDHQ